MNDLGRNGKSAGGIARGRTSDSAGYERDSTKIENGFLSTKVEKNPLKMVDAPREAERMLRRLHSLGRTGLRTDRADRLSSLGRTAGSAGCVAQGRTGDSAGCVARSGRATPQVA